MNLRGLMAVATTLTTTLTMIACGGGAPKQADAPKANLDDPPADSANSGGNTTTGDLGAAHAALEAKDFATARTKAEAVIAKTPNNAEALFILGNCDEADKKSDDAVTHYKGALAADGKLTGASINLSALLYDLKRYDEAIDVGKAAIAKSKGTAELHINLGYAYRGKGDHASASKSFGNAVALKPDEPDLRLWHAEELLATDDKDGAQKEFKNAIAKAGDQVDVIASAAIGLAQSGDNPGCVSALDKVLQNKSTSAKPAKEAEFLTERGICKHKAKDLAGARADLDVALSKSPSLKAHAAAAKYAEEAGDKKMCKQHFAEAIKMAEGRPTIVDELKKGLDRCK